MRASVRYGARLALKCGKKSRSDNDRWRSLKRSCSQQGGACQTTPLPTGETRPRITEWAVLVKRHPAHGRTAPRITERPGLVKRHPSHGRHPPPPPPPPPHTHLHTHGHCLRVPSPCIAAEISAQPAGCVQLRLPFTRPVDTLNPDERPTASVGGRLERRHVVVSNTTAGYTPLHQRVGSRACVRDSYATPRQRRRYENGYSRASAIWPRGTTQL